MNAMQYGKAVHLPPSLEVLVSVSAETESGDSVCVQRSSALLLPWCRGEGEGGEQVAHLVLGLRGQQLVLKKLDNSQKTCNT